MKVLNADDDAQNRYLLEAMLKGLGWEVVSVCNGMEALRCLERDSFDLIISDILMPEMDGFQLCRTVKASAKLAGIPFVFYTATYTDPKDEELGLSLGASRFIIKPAEPDQFAAVLREVVQSADTTRMELCPPPAEERVFLRSYNERLVQKLDRKIAQLMELTRQLQGALDQKDREAAERRQAELALRQAEETYRSLVENLPQGVFRKDMGGRYTFANQRFCQMVGCALGELLGQTDQVLFPKAVAEKHQANNRFVLQTSQTLEVEEILKSPDGQEYTLEKMLSPLRDTEGNLVGLQGLCWDITEKRQLETRFLRAQRMESLGSLAGGIAHDLNNVLAPIMLLLPVLKGEIRDPATLSILESVEAAAQRGADIVRQVLAFSRGTKSGHGSVRLQQVIAECGQLIRETFPRNIALRVNAPKDLWMMEGDPTQLHQVLMNLCVNARDAMAEGGTLTLAAENVWLDEATAARIPNTRPGAYIALLVADTGTGISPEHMDHIFDPFFTTKEPGKGTGLGLSTVMGIVRGHNGCIQVESQPGHGTQFRIYLPAKDAPAEPLALPPESAPPGHGELILVVDDEEAIRNTSQRLLSSYNYRVITARHGGEALAVFRRQPSEIQAVITDMMMPEMDGPATIRELRALNPQLKIIGTSGLTSDASLASIQPPLAGFVRKPCPPTLLLDVLRKVLDGRPVQPPDPI